MRPGLLLLCAALIWGTALFTRAPQRQQELRVLITARNLVEAGDPLHFEFQNQPRYRKPPLAYWTAAAGVLITGQRSSAWAGRLFFLAAALGGLWLFQKLAGTVPALLMLFTYGSMVYGPLAETDFLQLTGLILAFWGWNRENGWTSGAGMVLAALTKGPGGVAVPLLCFLILIRSHPRSLGFWVQAVLLPLLAGGGWILYLQLDPVASAALKADLAATFVDTDHRNPLPYYVWTLPLVMAPVWLMAVAVPGLRRHLLQGGQHDSPATRIALTWFWVTFVLLTLTVSKQRHYALMLLPPACWWLGIRLQSVTWNESWIRNAARGVCLLQIGVALFSVENEHAAFLHRSRSRVADSETVHVVGINSARFDFHLGRHVENTDSVQHAYQRAAPGDAVVVVKKAEAWEEPEGLPEPLLKADDGIWVRRLWVK